MQGFFDLLVHRLHHPIALRVAGIGEHVIDAKPHAVQVHTAGVNWVPLSVMTVAGTPKHATQLAMRAFVHVLASMLRSCSCQPPG